MDIYLDSDLQKYASNVEIYDNKNDDNARQSTNRNFNLQLEQANYAIEAALDAADTQAEISALRFSHSQIFDTIRQSL